MNLHPRHWIDRVPGWLIAVLGLCGLLTAAVGDHWVLTLALLVIAGALAAYRYQAALRSSDLWSFEEWFTARRAAFGIHEWQSPYQAAALYCTPTIVAARDEAAREMNTMMMELVRGSQKAPAFSAAPTTAGSTEPPRLTQQTRYETAQVRHEQCNAALGRELMAQLASGALMAKGLLLSSGAAKSERIIATPRWRLLELNIAKSEASGPAGEYAGIVIGKPTVKSQTEPRRAIKPLVSASKPVAATSPASRTSAMNERPKAGPR